MMGGPATFCFKTFAEVAASKNKDWNREKADQMHLVKITSSIKKGLENLTINFDLK